MNKAQVELEESISDPGPIDIPVRYHREAIKRNMTVGEFMSHCVNLVISGKVYCSHRWKRSITDATGPKLKYGKDYKECRTCGELWFTNKAEPKVVIGRL